MYRQGWGNIELTTGHFDLFSAPFSCSSYTLYTVQFQFTGHSLDLSDNVLHNWLFPHHCVQSNHIQIHTYIEFMEKQLQAIKTLNIKRYICAYLNLSVYISRDFSLPIPIEMYEWPFLSGPSLHKEHYHTL